MIEETDLPALHRAALALVREEHEPSTMRVAGHLSFVHGFRGEAAEVMEDLQRGGFVHPVYRGVKRWRATP